AAAVRQSSQAGNKRDTFMKRAIIALAIIGVIGAGAGAYYIKNKNTDITVNTSPITRGDIIDTVGATGTLQAVTTVLVGSQVSGRSRLPQSDLDAAKIPVDSAQAMVQSSKATVEQAQANLNQAQVNLDHTVITAPIDGIVIQRNVDVGQTVAASMQAPTLFIIAADLTKMQVNANIDEADVGRIRPGQHVTFRVDAYPTEAFEGTVSQIRLQPVVVQNVTTYGTVIDVRNEQLKLKP